MKLDSRLRKMLAKMAGKPCWYVACGGAAGSSFSLAIGGKEKCESPLKNKAHPLAFRANDPEFGLLVWCTWRLSRNGKVFVTSDDCGNKRGSADLLRRLRGRKVLRVSSRTEFCDLVVGFSGAFRLDVFCDHGRIAPSIEANWELFNGARYIGGV